MIADELVSSIPYFSGLGPEALQAVRQSLFEKRVERGEIVLLEGEASGALFFVIEGAVKVFKTSPEGKEQILSIARPGDVFNDVTVFDGGVNPASAQAMGPALLYGISRGDLMRIVAGHPQIAANIIRMLAQRLRQMVALVEDLSFRPVIGRVAKILLQYATEATTPRPRLTQQDIAAMAGTAREVVGRSLKALEEDGVIRLEKHRVVITRKESLQQLAAEAG